VLPCGFLTTRWRRWWIVGRILWRRILEFKLRRRFVEFGRRLSRRLFRWRQLIQR
jgi:hypothetical protein